MAKTKSKYWPNCQVCQHMKKHPDFREAVMRSTYVDPKGQETLLSVNARFGSLFKISTLYRHMQKHQGKDIEQAQQAAQVFGIADPNWQRNRNKDTSEVAKVEEQGIKELLDDTEGIVDKPVLAKDAHEQTLDDIIKLGQQRVKSGQIVLSATNLIAAIKVKADIERSTKDRRMEMLKAMFMGAAPSASKQGDGASQ